MPTDDPRILRLGPAHVDEARRAFAMMAEVFEEERSPLSDGYLEGLLSRPGFWAFVAVVGGEIAGCVTGHTLPMTLAERSEIFLYDLAVRPEHQRRGLGRRLVAALADEGAKAGIDTVFVPADDEDLHALDFYRAIGGEASKVTLFVFSR